MRSGTRAPTSEIGLWLLIAVYAATTLTPASFPHLERRSISPLAWLQRSRSRVCTAPPGTGPARSLRSS